MIKRLNELFPTYESLNQLSEQTEELSQQILESKIRFNKEKEEKKEKEKKIEKGKEIEIEKEKEKEKEKETEKEKEQKPEQEQRSEQETNVGKDKLKSTLDNLTTKIQTIKNERKELIGAINDIQEKFNNSITEIKKLEEDLQSSISLKEEDTVIQTLEWLTKNIALGSKTDKIETNEKPNLGDDEILEKFNSLFVKGSIIVRCGKLDELQKLYNKYVKHKGKELQGYLKKANWPQVKFQLDQSTESIWKAFERSFLELVSIQARKHFSFDRGSKTDLINSLSAMEMAFDPLKKRFIFHFLSPEQQTSRTDKPHWVFKYVLNQLRDHARFFTQFIQALIINCGSTLLFDVHSWVASQYVKLLSKKFQILLFDKIDPQESPQLYIQAINEICKFDQQLHHEFDFPKSQKGVLSIFSTDKAQKYFEKWIRIERNIFQKQFSSFMRESNNKNKKKNNDDDNDENDPWAIQNEELIKQQITQKELKNKNLDFITTFNQDNIKNDKKDDLDENNDENELSQEIQKANLILDELRASRSVTQFVTLLSNGFEKIKMFNNTKQCLSFLDGIIFQLLDKYLLAIKKSLKDPRSSRLQHYCSLINSAFFVQIAMQDWGEELFFIKIKYSQVRGVSFDLQEIESKQDLLQVDGSIFDEHIANYRNQVKRMTDILIEEVFKNGYSIYKTTLRSNHQEKKVHDQISPLITIKKMIQIPEIHDLCVSLINTINNISKWIVVEWISPIQERIYKLCDNQIIFQKFGKTRSIRELINYILENEQNY
ncbi:rad50-interacting protein [Anaeramoeba flamelloides]|uniref:Rad50-interacting protein n=1 Tax=Anaeramoeba flamelloides TaxID=1746091 RepID=A0AAV7Y5S5_9EUKA|nr:rad50-interacting protein [Anaeramoeba flamelloides]